MQSYACPPVSKRVMIYNSTHAAATSQHFAVPDTNRGRPNCCLQKGSLLVFTESLLHATAEWTHPTRERIAIFTHYCSIYSQYHRLLLPHEAIVTMPKLRQSLFRGVWDGDWGGLDGQKAGERGNVHYSETNSAADSIVYGCVSI